MSKSLITRSGRKCWSCNNRRKTVVSRAVPRLQYSPNRVSGRFWSKPRTLLCDECDEQRAAQLGTRIGSPS